MKKKVLSLLLVAAMGLTMLVGCGGGKDTDADKDGANKDSEVTYDYTGVEIKVWVADEVKTFTEEQIAAWKTANPEMKDIVVTVESVGEGEAATNLITDVTAGADVYGFAQDQITRLVAAEAIMPIGGQYAEDVKKNNDAGSVGASTVGDKLYAFPITSDNGFFMYYDKSVVTDISSLDAVLAACEAAGKNFYFEVNSAWYNSAFFYAAGCNLEYTTGDDGNYTDSNFTIASDAGVAATKAMIAMAKSKAHVNGSSIGNATNVGAIVDGVWDKTAAQELLGENFACAKLPTCTLDGKQVQMSGMGGYKLIGVKPQTEPAKQNACYSLAAYLSSEEVQLARFNAVGWGPSNMNAQKNEAVAADPTLTALADQMQYMIPQGQYQQTFWDDVKAFGSSIDSGEFDNLTDAEILQKLTDLQTKLEGYVVK